MSREKRTRDFLGKADVVLMMLYAGRPFDATDREIIFKHLSSCGIGKLVIGINKYDIPFENGETEEEIKEYVIDEIRKASQGMKDDSLKELLREATPIPFSAEMALLSYLPMNSINTNERYKYAWERYCDNFEIGTQIDFRNKSLLFDLSERILDIIMKEKAAILFAKPRNSIKAAIQNFRLKIELEIKAVKDNITNMSLLDDDLDKKQTNLNKAKKRLEKKTENYLYELREGLCELTGEYSDKITHIVSGLCEDAQRAIDNFGSTETADVMKQKVDEILSPLTARIIRQEIKRLKGQRKKTSIRITEDYTDEVSTLLSRFFEDIDTSDVLLELKRICDIEQIDESVREDIEELLSEFKHRSRKRIWFSNSKTKVDIKDSILKYQENFDIDERLKKIMDIENLEPRIKELMFENFLIPLQNNLKEVVENKEKRQQMLSDAQTKLERLKLQQEDMNKKIATIIL